MELLLGLLILAAASYFSYLYYKASKVPSTTEKDTIELVEAKVEETVKEIETEVVAVVKKARNKAASTVTKVEDEVKTEVAKVKAARKPKAKTTK